MVATWKRCGGDRNRIENGPVRGTDYDATPLGTLNCVEPGTTGWYGIDVSELVRQWVNGGAPNEGLFMQAHRYWIGAYFASGNNHDASLRPKLTVRSE